MHGKDHVYNVGGVSQVTIANLAGKIGEILKVPVKIPEVQEKFLLDAPLEVRLDLTKIEELSGKKDYVDINLGLEETILWMKHNLNKAKV
jgi:nucleoside-diphosphate-sugar epimerase